MRSDLAIVMELVEGQSLRALLKSRQLSSQQTIQIGRQIASALAAAHQKGIVHRDIKPENIMVRVDGYVKVLDFGLAQNIRERALGGRAAHLPVGTVRYMPPEQKFGEEVTGASDVYSLALVLEELGKWRHPLLTQMRSAAPEQRPSAEKVALQLERLERSNHYLLLAVSLVFLVAIGGFLLFQSWNQVHPSQEPRFEQITRYTTGHDVTVAELSPDGERLGYATVDGGLFVRNNRTSTVRELDAPEGFSIHQLFFPSDLRLLAVGMMRGNFEAWTIPLNGSAAARLRTNTETVALSHDRKRIAWLNEQHEVWTGLLDGGEERFAFRSKPDEKIAMLFWSANDRDLWFHRLRHCQSGFSSRDVFVNPDNCDSSDLVSYDPVQKAFAVKVSNLRLTSGFFADNGKFFFLRQDIDRRSEALNLWSLRADPGTGDIIGAPQPLSHLNGVVLSQLTGSRDSRTMAVVRMERIIQTHVGEWQATPDPMLQNPRRLTLESVNSFPHAWTPDNQSVILESDRSGHIEIFRQKLTRREAELLVSTPDDVYMPQVTPDGNWLLMMSRVSPSPGKPDDLSRHRLLRAPINGGQTVEVPLGEPLDEFRCSLPGRGTGCVLRVTHGHEQRYFDLDPMRGKGRELGRTAFAVDGLGRWSLSADGTKITIPDTHRAGCFLEIRLDPVPARRWEQERQVKELGIIDGIAPLPSGNGWLANSAMNSFQILEVPSRTEDLYYIDSRLNPHRLYKNYVGTYGVFSPDEKHIAFLGTDLTSNIWAFQR
jgi:hypothetical protein